MPGENLSDLSRRLTSAQAMDMAPAAFDIQGHHLPILAHRYTMVCPGTVAGEKRAREESTGGVAIAELHRGWRGDESNARCARPAEGLHLSYSGGLCSDWKASHSTIKAAGRSATYGGAMGCHVAHHHLATRQEAQETAAELKLNHSFEAVDRALRVPALKDTSLHMTPPITIPSSDVSASASAATAAALHHDRSVPTATRVASPASAPRVHHPTEAETQLAGPSGRPVPQRGLSHSDPPGYPIHQQRMPGSEAAFPGHLLNKRARNDPGQSQRRHASGTPSSETFRSIAESGVREESGERGRRVGSGSSAATGSVADPGCPSHQIVALQNWVLRAEESARVEAVRADRLEGAATQLASQLQNSELQFVSAVQLALRLSERLKQAHALNAMLMQEPGALGTRIPHGVPRDIPGRRNAAEEERESFCGAESCGSVHVKGEADESMNGNHDKKWCAESADRSEDTEKYAVEILAHEDRLCLLCKEDVACTVALPCRHLTLCKGCSKSAVECPKCLGTMHSVLHIEM